MTGKVDSGPIRQAQGKAEDDRNRNRKLVNCYTIELCKRNCISGWA